MSLNRELPSGVVTTYHRILRANINFDPPEAYVTDGVPVLVELEIGEYLSKEARDSGLKPANREVRCIPANEETKSILAGIYKFLSDSIEGDQPALGYEGSAAV